MTDPNGLDQPAAETPAQTWQALRHLMTSIAWAWLPRSWATEWLVLLGLILAEVASRLLPAIAVAVRHG